MGNVRTPVFRISIFVVSVSSEEVEVSGSIVLSHNIY